MSKKKLLGLICSLVFICIIAMACNGSTLVYVSEPDAQSIIIRTIERAGPVFDVAPPGITFCLYNFTRVEHCMWLRLIEPENIESIISLSHMPISFIDRERGIGIAFTSDSEKVMRDTFILANDDVLTLSGDLPLDVELVAIGIFNIQPRLRRVRNNAFTPPPPAEVRASMRENVAAGGRLFITWLYENNRLQQAD